MNSKDKIFDGIKKNVTNSTAVDFTVKSYFSSRFDSFPNAKIANDPDQQQA